MSSHDTRYLQQQDKWSLSRRKLSKVALMYLPLLTAMTIDSSFLNILDFENSKDTVKKTVLNKEDENNFDSHCASDSYKSN